MKVKEVIAALENAIPLPFPQTCDIYHIGNPEAEVQKIASVFMADGPTGLRKEDGLERTAR